MRSNLSSYEFELDNLFFADIDAPEVQRGKVDVQLTVTKALGSFVLTFHTEGVVWVPCDRCLDDMEQPIASDDELIVKFGADYGEEGDNIIVIPEEDDDINVAWYMYEFIALSIPMKHVHAPGKCNKAMNSKLKQHLSVFRDDLVEEEKEALETDGNWEDAEKAIDPRWNELKKILDNN